MMGHFQKDTDIITNDPGIIYMFGVDGDAPGNDWWPDAPSPNFICTPKQGDLLESQAVVPAAHTPNVSP